MGLVASNNAGEAQAVVRECANATARHVDLAQLDAVAALVREADVVVRCADSSRCPARC